MDVIRLLLYAAAAVCFALTALGVAGRVNVLALGLLAWVLVHVVDAVQAVD